MKLLINALVQDASTDKGLEKQMVYAQVFDKVKAPDGRDLYIVGNMIQDYKGSAYILLPQLSVKITEELLKKVKETEVRDANIYIPYIPGAFS